MWKGNNVTIKPLHEWINRNKPKPSSGLCEICNNAPLYDAACVTGIYNRDFKNWKYACRSCHQKYDFENGTRSHEKISEALSGEKHPMYRKRGKYNPNWRDFNQTCQCGSRYVVRGAIRRGMQIFICTDCNKRWSVEKSLLEQYYSKIPDSKIHDNRRCSVCNSDKTSIKKDGCPVWRRLDSSRVCTKCYARKTYRRKNQVGEPRKAISISPRVLAGSP